MNEEQCRFMAQHETVTIVPQFTLDTINLLSGTFGPFRIHYPSNVPLWLALFLHGSKACVVRAPPWLTVENLSALLEYEKTHETFAAMPHYYMEIAEMLLESCPEDFGGQSDNLGRLLGALDMARWQKVLRDLDVFRSAGLVNAGLRVTNLTSIELRKLRPIMLRIMDHGSDLETLAETRRGRGAGGDYSAGGGRGSVVAGSASWSDPTMDLGGRRGIGGMAQGGGAHTEVSLATDALLAAPPAATGPPKRRRTLRDV